MARLIAIMGESGSGKTTGMRTLDPATTFYIDVDGKGLSWKGWRTQYHGSTAKGELPNYISVRDIPVIRGSIEKIATDPKYTHVKTIVVDTLNTAMVDKEVKSMKEKSYDKWIDLASYVWDLIEAAGKLRDVNECLVDGETVKSRKCVRCIEYVERVLDGSDLGTQSIELRLHFSEVIFRAERFYVFAGRDTEECGFVFKGKKIAHAVFEFS